MGKPIRILVIDDSAFNRQTITAMLEGTPGFQVVGRAADGEEGLKQAFALQQTGRAAEAVPIYRELLASYPRWVNVHYNLGHALMALGRHSEAAGEFRRTLELEPGLTAAHLHLATCLRALGRAEEARRELERYEGARAQR